MKKLSCCDTGCTKDVQITIANEGSESKTFRLFNYGNELPSVDDNTNIGTPTVESNIAAQTSDYLVYVNSKNYLFAAGFGDTSISVINTETNLPVSSINIGAGIGKIVYGGGNYIYASIFNSGDVYVIDVNDFTFTTISTGNSNGYYSQIYNNKLYVPSPGSGVIAVIDITTNTFLYNTPLVGNVRYITLGGNYLFGMNSTSGNMVVVNINTNSIVTTLPIGIVTSNTLYSLQYLNDKVYVGASSSSVVKIVDAVNITILSDTIPFSAGREFQYYDDFIIGHGTGGTIKINTLDNTYIILNTISSIYATYSYDTNRIYISYYPPYNSVDIYDADDNSLLYTLTGFNLPISLSAPGNAYVYSSSQAIAQVTPINENISIPVTITVNGGVTSLEQLNSETSNNPIGMCGMKISTSQLSVYQNPIQKILWSSAGEQVTYPITLGSYVTAYNTPEVSTITIPGKDLQQNNLLNGTNYIQGIIPANSYMSMVISYCQFTSANIVGGNGVYCGDNWGQVPNPIRKKKRYSRASFRFLKGNN